MADLLIPKAFIYFLGYGLPYISAALMALLIVLVACRRRPWTRRLWRICLIASGSYLVYLVAAFFLLLTLSGSHRGWLSMGFIELVAFSTPIIVFFLLLWLVRLCFPRLQNASQPVPKPV